MNVWTLKRAPVWIEYERKQDRTEIIPCPITNEHSAVWRDRGSLAYLVKAPIPDLTALIGGWVLSERALKVFLAAKLTGFDVRPATVRERFRRGKVGPVVPYHELVFVGWGGLINPSTGSHPVSQCPACGFTEFSPIKNMDNLFDKSQWDGSDFFMIWPIGEYVSDRVKMIVEEHCLTGVEFLPLDSRKETLAKHVAYNPPSAAGLRWILPEPRASEIGKPLGIY